MTSKKRDPNKHEGAARGRRVPIDELMALPETVHSSEDTRRSEEYQFPWVRSSQRLPAALKAAWDQWSETMNVDPRTLLLLRAAFQAGYEAEATVGNSSSPLPCRSPLCYGIHERLLRSAAATSILASATWKRMTATS